jgi:hypothetical protein
MRFFGCETPPPTKPSLLCWLILGIGRLASSLRSKPSSWKAGDLYAILLYRDNGGAAAADTANRYMRRVTGGGSTTSRWLSNERCLPLREKDARAIHASTWHICGEPLPPPAQMWDDQPCASNNVDKGWLQISLFYSEDCRLRCEMVKFEWSIRIGNQ